MIEVFLATTDETDKQVSHPIGRYKGKCEEISPAKEMGAITGAGCSTGGGGTELHAVVQGNNVIVMQMGTMPGTASDPMAREEVKQVYVARLPLQTGDKQWIVVQPRGVRFQGYQLLDVKRDPVAIGIGDEAPASDTPTTANHAANRITTAKPPDVGLLRYSVKDSVESGKPFVVAFATPAFCQSRTCGPTVDVVAQ